MSKKFKSQDYLRYKKLGKRWRKPVGWQSKLRLGKSGSGLRVSIGYGSPAIARGKIRGADYRIVRNLKDLESVGKSEAIIIASGVGARKARLIAGKGKELDIRILNMKKVKRADRLSKEIEKKHAAKKKEKKEEKKQEKESKTEQKAEIKETKGESKPEKEKSQ